MVPQLQGCSTAPSVSQHPSCAYCHGTFSLVGKGGPLSRLWVVMVVRGLNSPCVLCVAALSRGGYRDEPCEHPSPEHSQWCVAWGGWGTAALCFPQWEQGPFPTPSPSVHQQKSSTSAGLLVSLEFTPQHSSELSPPYSIFTHHLWIFLIFFDALFVLYPKSRSHQAEFGDVLTFWSITKHP